jgi:hypothetical protein
MIENILSRRNHILPEILSYNLDRIAGKVVKVMLRRIEGLKTKDKNRWLSYILVLFTYTMPLPFVLFPLTITLTVENNLKS